MHTPTENPVLLKSDFIPAPGNVGLIKYVGEEAIEIDHGGDVILPLDKASRRPIERVFGLTFVKVHKKGKSYLFQAPPSARAPLLLLPGQVYVATKNDVQNLASSPLFEKVEVEKGEEIEVPEMQHEPAREPKKSPTEEEQTDEIVQNTIKARPPDAMFTSIADAVAALDENNPDHFNKDGTPKQKVVSAMVEDGATADEVREGWEAHLKYKEENPEEFLDEDEKN